MTEPEDPEIDETVEECGCKVRRIVFRKRKVCILTVDCTMCSQNHIDELGKPISSTTRSRKEKTSPLHNYQLIKHMLKHRSDYVSTSFIDKKKEASKRHEELMIPYALLRSPNILQLRDETARQDFQTIFNSHA